MPQEFHQVETDTAVVAEQIKAFFKETNAQNLAGAVVLSLIIWVAAAFVPLWSWAPALTVAYCVTATRAYLIWRYHRRPEAKTPEQWGRGQTIGAALNGASWGLANAAMSAHLPLPYQLFIVTVAAVSASAAASEGFAYFYPSRAFICTSLIPLTLWFYSEPDRLHLILGVMLSIYIPVLLWQGDKRQQVFIDSLKLRFKTELLANALAQQRKIAEDADKAKARFLAAASHDLRQPVQALALFQELMRPEMKLTAKGEDYFAKMQQAVEAVSSLLVALMDISRLDSNTVTPKYECILVSALLDEMQREFTPLAERNGVQLRVVHCSACLDTDLMLLRQILRNLLSNALRYTPAGKILIGCRRRHGQLAIEVWDTGIGIRDDHQQAIFAEFFQVGNHERNRQQGLGLGLAIVDRAARLLGATVSVRSRLGNGSGFSVALPMGAEQTPPSPRAFRETVSPFDLTGRLIVVVENEEMIRHGIHTLIENWGCNVISGQSGDSVLAQIQNQARAVDAVISDFGLSAAENGIDVIGKLRAYFGSQLPALLVTGDTRQATLQTASQAGLTILHKPVRPWLLRRTLCALINPTAGSCASDSVAAG